MPGFWRTFFTSMAAGLGWRASGVVWRLLRVAVVGLLVVLGAKGWWLGNLMGWM